MTTAEPTVQWSQDQMVEVVLNEPDDFLKVRETLTRIGVASRKEKKLYQSCHILHKQGRYYIVHFKELFALDGKHANLTSNDVQRRNRITRLLADWGLISVVKPDSVSDIAPLNQIKVLAYKDKGDWILEQKYNIGKKGKTQDADYFLYWYLQLYSCMLLFEDSFGYLMGINTILLASLVFVNYLNFYFTHIKSRKPKKFLRESSPTFKRYRV